MNGKRVVENMRLSEHRSRMNSCCRPRARKSACGYGKMWGKCGGWGSLTSGERCDTFPKNIRIEAGSTDKMSGRHSMEVRRVIPHTLSLVVHMYTAHLKTEILSEIPVFNLGLTKKKDVQYARLPRDLERCKGSSNTTVARPSVTQTFSKTKRLVEFRGTS
jgi:hypothetical protein